MNIKYKQHIIFPFLSLLCLVLLSLSSHIVYANDFKQTLVSYTKTETITYPLCIYIKGNGAIKVGNDILRNTNKNYLLPIDESMTIEFIIDEDSYIKSVLLDDENITSHIINNELIIDGKEHKQELYIEFHTKPSHNQVNTRDDTQMMMFINMMILSIGLLICLWIGTDNLGGNEK